MKQSAVENPQNEQWNSCLTRVAGQADRTAFYELFRHFAPLIKRYALSTQPRLTEAQAEEVVQEVMIKVWVKAGTFNQSKASASTWIFTIARNTRIDLLRKSQQLEMPLDVTDLFPEDEAEDDTPFLQLQQERNRSQVKAALDILGWEQKEVMGKVYLEGKTHQQVADETGLSLGTVKSRIRLALKKMSIRFGD